MEENKNELNDALLLSADWVRSGGRGQYGGLDICYVFSNFYISVKIVRTRVGTVQYLPPYLTDFHLLAVWIDAMPGEPLSEVVHRRTIRQ